MKQMKSQLLLDPRPEAPFLGYSINSLISIVGDFEEPSWIDVPDSDDDGGSYKKTKHQHKCEFKLLGMIKPPLSKLKRNARGLNLDDIPPSQGSRKSHNT